MPITLSREKSVQLVKDYNKKHKLVAIVAQKDSKIEDPVFSDLFKTGTLAQIIRILELPDGSTSVIIQGKKRISLIEAIQEEPYIIATVKELVDIKPKMNQEYEAIIATLKDMSIKIIRLSANIPNEASFAIKNITNPSFLVNFICANTDSTIEEKQNLLETDDLKIRASSLLKILAKQTKILEIRNDILTKARTDIEQQQKDYFLHQQLKTIQNELGVNSIEHEIEEMKAKAKNKKWNKDISKHFEREITKLQRMNPQSGEHSIQINYIQTLLELPWNEYSDDNFDIRNAQNILDQDHFGMEKVKERILEHLAVLKLKGDMKSPIICLYGPPGVGKTSLGRSIAKALNRSYVRVSLGGMHDEAEIRGHRKTYIGAMPGRIIQNIKKAGTSNPVFILDEIDKIGKDAHGDPESALLEVLDPEQNFSFHDNYLEVDYDLSKVMFIATANNIQNISNALRDRMELIEVSGYIQEEKLEIAKRHLFPNQLKNHGMAKSQLNISDSALKYLINYYTRESGVRSLEKKIAKLIRNTAKKIAVDEHYNKTINAKSVLEVMGAHEFSSDIYEGNEIPGVVTGLAWTATGGDILFIETSLSKGKGNLTLTGNLGNVMKESATIAMQYIKANADYFNIPSSTFSKWDFHLHVPEGAIPKDGPSAGITMATSIVSAITGKKIKKNIAMTGEITLRGKVLPVGGIKEKILAAKRAEIKEIILCLENKKNVEEINQIYLKGLKFHYINNVKEVMDISLLNEYASKK